MDGRATSSDRKTADAVIKATPVYVTALTLNGDGINSAAAVLYNDATAATGTILAEVAIDGSENKSRHVTFIPPIWASVGVFLDLTGTNASAIVYTK